VSTRQRCWHFTPFARHLFIEATPGLASRFQIAVTEPAVTHEVSLVQVREWVKRNSSNQAEVVRRKRLREMLEESLPKK
jgi:hypothetical protein